MEKSLTIEEQLSKEVSVLRAIFLVSRHHEIMSNENMHFIDVGLSTIEDLLSKLNKPSEDKGVSTSGHLSTIGKDS